MLRGVLRSDIGPDSQYFQDFEKLVGKDRLELPYLYSCFENKETCYIGQVIEDFLGYDKALRLRILESLSHDNLYNHESKSNSPSKRRLYLNVGDVFGNKRIGIGLIDGYLDVFREKIDMPVTSYPLFDIKYTRSKSRPLMHKNFIVDEFGRLIDENKNFVDEKGSKVGKDNAVWALDIPKMWVKVPEQFISKTIELIGPTRLRV